MKYKIIFLLFVITLNTNFAQVTQEKRIELNLFKGDWQTRTVIPMGDKGLIVSAFNKDNFDEHAFFLYDTGLNKMDVEMIKPKEKVEYLRYYSNSKSVFLWYYVGDDKYAIYELNFANKDLKKLVEFKRPKWTSVEDWVVWNDRLYYSCYVKGKPFIFTVDIKTGKKKEFPMAIDGVKVFQATYGKMNISKETKEVLTTMIASKGKKEVELYFIKMDAKGDVTVNKKLETDNVGIKNILLSSDNEGGFVLTGSYTGINPNESVGEGLFFGDIKNDQLKIRKFKNFFDLEKFISLLPEKEQKKIKEKVEKKKSKGKFYNYWIHTNKVFSVDGSFILVGEIYYPVFSTDYTKKTGWMYHARPDGYIYTHAIILKYDKNGEIVWDQVFDMGNKHVGLAENLSYEQENNLTVQGGKDDIKIVYVDGKNNVVTKTISYDGKVIKDDQSEKIGTGKENDESKFNRDWGSSITVHWYGDYFLAFGKQKVKNKDEGKREVFFVTKLKY